MEKKIYLNTMINLVKAEIAIINATQNLEYIDPNLDEILSEMLERLSAIVHTLDKELS